MNVPLKLARAELYLREDSLRVCLTRRGFRPHRTVTTWYKAKRSMFLIIFTRFTHHFGVHSFKILSTGTWIYSWEVDRDQSSLE